MIASKSTHISVIIPVPMEGVFTYAVPLHLQQETKVGSIVKCAFGTRIYAGVVHSFTSETITDFEIKNISDVIYPDTFISEKIIRFWEWIAEYYICSIGDVLKAALPPTIIPSSKPKYHAVYNAKAEKLKGNAQLIFDLLLSKKLTVSGITRNTGIKSVKPVLVRLMEKGLVQKELPEGFTASAQTETYVALNEKFQNKKAFELLIKSLNNAKARQRALLAVYNNQDDGLTKAQLREHFSISSNTYKQLLENGALCEFERELSFRPDEADTNLSFLSPEQEKAYFSIRKQFQKQNTVLLHGVTSSGKTEVYFHLIADAIKRDEQVLVLLPEITLTNSIVARFKEAFGEAIKVYHSKINDKERARVWHGVRNNSIKIVVGVRSAIFLPFQHLGLSIVDEEHENTYKQDDPAPRYHARDSLIMMAHIFGSKVLLGSATPSVQSYHNAAEGKYGLAQLLNRHNETALPEIVIEDLIDCYKKNKLKKHFSFTLIKAVQESLEKGEQVILFQNRRGYAPTVECKDCGYVHLCPNCNVSLTIHKTGRNLECHYCGHKEPIFDYCPECNSIKIRDKGMGTEKIEDEIYQLFPGKRVARIDTDTAGKTQNVQQVFKLFGAGQLDILVGTQMISKGLDFDNVGTVGVLNADNLLNFPNYSASERSFQLLTQVAGRAGRKHGNGKVIVQTHQPDHPVLKAVQRHDYISFCGNELEERELFKYPPFVKLIHINMRHANEGLVEAFAQQLASEMQVFKGGSILGPEKPGVDKIKNYYYRRISLKLAANLSRKKLKEWLTGLSYHLLQQVKFRGVQVNFDADPNA